MFVSTDRLLRCALQTPRKQIDVHLSPNKEIGAVVADLLAWLPDFYSSEELGIDLEAKGVVWSFSREGSPPFSRDETLNHYKVTDADRLILRASSPTEVFQPLVEDVSDAIAAVAASRFPAYVPGVSRVLGVVAFVVSWLVGLYALVRLWLVSADVRCGYVALAGALVVWVLGVLAQYRWGQLNVSKVLSVLSVVTGVFGGGLVVVPDEGGVSVFTAVFGAVGGVVGLFFVSLIRIFQKFMPAFVVSYFTGWVLVELAFFVRLFTSLDEESLVTCLVACAVGMLLLSANFSVIFSKVQLPRIPAPEDEVDISDYPRPVPFDERKFGRLVGVSGDDRGDIARNVADTNNILTGILCAACLIIAICCPLIPRVGGTHFWVEMGFVVCVGVGLFLRQRSHTDLLQGIVLFVTCYCVFVGVLVHVSGFISYRWGVDNLLCLLLVVFGVVAWFVGAVLGQREFSPAVKRWIELLSSGIYIVVIPLFFWITGIFGWLRHVHFTR